MSAPSGFYGEATAPLSVMKDASLSTTRLTVSAVAPPAVSTPEAPARPVSTATAARIGREVGARKGKAAFTLRLDPERHMKLRLACVYAHQSAQQLVTAALEEYLSTHFPDALKDVRKTAAN